MFKKMCLFASIVTLLLLFYTPLTADESQSDSGKNENLFTEEVEVVGNIPVVKTIQSVSIYKSEEIEKFNFENLKEVLQLTPGLLTLSNGPFGQSSTTSIRGSKSSQVLYIVDGIKLRDGSGIDGIDLAMISPVLLNKIEVVRGPLSSIYGSDAMGGVINIDTSSKEGAKFTASLGNYNSYSGGFSGSTLIKNWNIALSVNTKRFSDNVVNDVFKNSGLTSHLLYKTNIIETGIQFFGSHTNSGIPFNDYGISTPERKYKRQYQIIAVPFTYRPDKKSSIDVHLAYTGSKYEFHDVEDIWSPYYMSKFDNKEVEFTYSTNRFKNLNLRAGIDYSNQGITNKTDLGYTLDHVNMNYFSTFVSASWNIENFQVSTSIRYDKYKDTTSNFSPQIGISYLVANTLKFRASYANSFLAPFVSQIVNPWGLPNFDLKPEKGKSFEAGIEFYSKPVVLSATYFNTKYKDMIGWETIDWTTYEGQYQNIKNVDTYGLEFAAQLEPIENLRISGSYTYLHTKDLETLEPLIRKPKDTISISTVYSLKFFTIAANMIYVGKRPDYNYAIWPPDAINPSFNRFDFSVVVPLIQGLDGFGKITNAFNKKYQEFIGYPAAGRRFEIGLNYKL